MQCCCLPTGHHCALLYFVLLLVLLRSSAYVSSDESALATIHLAQDSHQQQLSISGSSPESRSLWSGLKDILRNGWKSYLIDRVSTDDGADDEDVQVFGNPAGEPGMAMDQGQGYEMDASKTGRNIELDEGVHLDDAADDHSGVLADEGDAARYLNFGVRPAFQLTGLPGKAAIVNFTASSANNLVQGALRLYQSTVYSEVQVQGTITGLTPGETINIHVRQRGDVTQQCNNQGLLYNPNGIPTGGFLVRSATASGTGVANIDERILGIEANLWGPFLLSIIRRSARISSGSQSAAGLTLACGTIIAAPVGPNTINARR